MKAILFILMITDASNFYTKGEVQYTLVDRQAGIEWESCAGLARDINEGSEIKVGAVTATCFPYTIEDSEEAKQDNDDSGHNS